MHSHTVSAHHHKQSRLWQSIELIDTVLTFMASFSICKGLTWLVSCVWREWSWGGWIDSCTDNSLFWSMWPMFYDGRTTGCWILERREPGTKKNLGFICHHRRISRLLWWQQTLMVPLGNLSTNLCMLVCMLSVSALCFSVITLKWCFMVGWRICLFQALACVSLPATKPRLSLVKYNGQKRWNVRRHYVDCVCWLEEVWQKKSCVCFWTL